MRIQNPLSGWPRTKPLKRKEGYRVIARYLTPGQAKLIDLVTAAGTLALLGWIFIWSWQRESPLGGIVACAIVGGIIGGLTAAGLFRWIGQLLIGARTVIEFQPELLRIKGLLGFRNYDRLLPHEFEYDYHEKAQDEEEEAHAAKERAAREGKKKLPRKEKYYRKSFQVILRYAGKRVDIASIFGKKKAEALLARLQLLDAMMDAARGQVADKAWSEPAKQYGVRPEAG